ncbi:Arc family DNA-binding protein [Paraflavitalea sp. CAU 1676]|uniref:Arc family DNA-binding protein n=1 Tax=Paraflavitalea sp. CAU 1676 TaxID=3032598 RepID=UPI0023DC9812|nr:Arc family DNA-binding protein [Paraflavitalea sp. CAU 1676]MDF2190120.1 Arc family DNA-binding protein [Paraflavitalea sp. CAU 1676]
MGSKKNFVLRIDEETFKSLEKWAADEFRSVNGQLEWIIDQALKANGRKKNPDNQPPADEPTETG